MSPQNDTPQDNDEAAPRTFRSKSVEIEAIRVRWGNNKSIADWINGEPDAYRNGYDGKAYPDFGGVSIPTETGRSYARPGDWVVRDVDGKFDSCLPDVFEATYNESELGVTKGLPGSGYSLSSILDLNGSLSPQVMSARMRAAGREAGIGVAGALDDLAPGATQAAKTGMEIAGRSIGFVSQKAGIAGTGLAGKFDELALSAALDLIGRRTDVVAVKLPEPDRVNERHDEQVWDVAGESAVILDRFGVVRTYFEDIWDDDDRTPSPDDLRAGAAALLAAASRADAANVADAAEDGGK